MPPAMETLTDAELLEACSACRDNPAGGPTGEAAFGELMRRHGAMVYRACLRLLKDAHEAKDASQAVFIVLARKTGELRPGDLSAWLYRVAHHVAAKAVRSRVHRTDREEAYAVNEAIQSGEGSPAAGVDPAALCLVDAALLSLPERYRQAVILRYLKNHSLEDAARLAGCSVGTLAVRTHRGLEQLRRRLVARGVALGTDGVTGVLEEEGATSVALPAALVAATCQAASLVAAGKTLTGTGLVSAKVAYLTKSALKTLFWVKVKTAAAAVLLTAAVAVGGGLVAQQVLAHRVATAPAPAPASSRQAWAWGWNGFGQLGTGTAAGSRIPVPVRLADGTTLAGVTAMAGARVHTVALRTNGSVWCWGPGQRGVSQDVVGPDHYAAGPVKLADGSPLAEVTAIAAGWDHTVVLKRNGSVWGWGWNKRGELGDGTTAGFVPNATPAVISEVTAIAAGEYFTVALKKDGSVWTWGLNDQGQLGRTAEANSYIGSATPTEVKTAADGAALPRFTAIACGRKHAVAVTAEGRVMTWGQNSWGRHQDGSVPYAPVTVKLPDGSPLSDVTAIAAGDGHTVALRADGSLWAWGVNRYGQLGDGTTTDREYPVQVAGSIPGVTKVAAGSGHTVALTADRCVWTWGGNEQGQLGDGTTTQRSVPVRVSGLTEVVSISAGMFHTLAITSAARPVVEERKARR